MSSLFQDLKQAREAKRISLNDVSDATLINVKFLEAIEQGNIDILPQTYIRAFIREYASFVGLDPVEIMKRYDQERNEPAPPPTPERSPTPEPAPSPENQNVIEEVNEPEKPRSPEIRRFALPAILVLALAVIIWNLTRTKPPQEMKEIESIDQQSGFVTDTAAQGRTEQSGKGTSSRDSLTLHATTLDSAWVQITIDNEPPQEYLFRPNRKMSWKARDQFRITLGNAGGVDLTLNQKHLGTLGKQGAVRSFELNRQTLLKK